MNIKQYFSIFLLVTSLAYPVGAADYTLHVAANAKPGGDGSSRLPYQNLTQARDNIRDGRKTGKLHTGQAVNVVVAPGDYHIESTFEIGSADGGTPQAPVIYRAEQPGTARIYGGVILSPGSFQPLKDKTALDRLDPSVRDKVLVCDLSGNKSFPPFKSSYTGAPPAPWLYLDSQPMTLARWPNVDAADNGWATFSEVEDNGLPQPSASNPALQKPHPGSFLFDDPRPARWNLDKGVWLFGYWTHDWSEEIIQMAAYDKAKQTIALAAPSKYGIKGHTWGSSKRRFFALNLLEELDAPGEWYLDRDTMKLYFYPPKPLDKSRIILSTLTSPMVQARGTSNVKFLGLRFEYGHSGGISLEETENVEIAGCTIANLAGYGISSTGKTNTIRSCDLYNLGETGIVLGGGNRKTLEAARNLAVNNHIHHYARFKRTYSPGIHVTGCGQIVRNNCIHDAPHNAVLYSGNQHLFELNEVYRVVMETGDAGAFYTGRDWTSQGNILKHNFIHDLGSYDHHYTNTMGVYLDDCDCGDTVQGNLFVRAGRAILVGGGRDNPILDNLIVDCQIGLNLDARGMTWKEWNNPANSSWCLEEKAKRLNYTQPPWSVKYPRLAAIMHEDPKQPLNNPIRRNVFVDCTKQVCDFDANVKKLLDKLVITDNLAINTTGSKAVAAAPQYKGFTNLSGAPGKLVDPGFADREKGDFSLRKDSLLFQKIPSFEPIPFAKIGLFQDEYRRLPSSP